MELFEKIGDAASKTYKYTADKTSKLAKETKTKIKINEYKNDIKDLYREIGEAVFEKFVVDEEVNHEEIQEKCNEIKALTEKIAECKDEILTLKEKKQCKNCYDEIDIDANYCPNCGSEQEKRECEKCCECEECENTEDASAEENEDDE